MAFFFPAVRPATFVATALVALAGCQSASMKPLAVAERVELERFMGDWYVIANIPTFLEKGAHNAVESYRLEGDGSIATTPAPGRPPIYGLQSPSLMVGFLCPF